MRRYPYSDDPRAFHVQREQRLDKLRFHEAITLTALRPVGLILVAGKPMAATCQGVSIPSGVKVRIIGQSFNELLVELHENQSFS